MFDTFGVWLIGIFISVISIAIAIAVVFTGVNYFKIEDVLFQTGYRISNTGIITTETYNRLNREIDDFGDFQIQLKYEDHIEGEYYDTYFDLDDILDVPMSSEDYLTIELVDTDVPLTTSLVSFLTGDVDSLLKKKTLHKTCFPIGKDY